MSSLATSSASGKTTMPLFCCAKCRCVENTAAANYWPAVDKGSALCSECDPAIGQWHGSFPKRSAVGMLVDQKGFLWSKEAVEAGQLPATSTIVGEIIEGGVQKDGGWVR